MPKENLPSQRVMLLLPADLVQFTDDLATQLSRSGVPLTRQDAIRHTLAQLRDKMTTAVKAPARRKR